MKVLETNDGVVLEVKVKPKSGSFRMQINEELTVFCKQAPTGGKVNRELVKELSKILRRKVEIVSGFRSRTKKLVIRDVTENWVLEKLKRFGEAQ